MAGNRSTNEYLAGFRDGIAIGLGYLSVSFTFGIMSSSMGFPPWVAVLISMTNLTSAGQFAGLPLIAAGAPLVEVALTQLIINLRYALMSLSLTQKFDDSIKQKDRFFLAFFNTDEIFAVASGQPGLFGKRYYYGLSTTPYFGWAIGTLLGAVAGGFLPPSVQSALGIAIYAMFIAIIIPPARSSRSITAVIAISSLLSCLFYFTPLLREVSSGFVIIICTLLAATAGALLFPVKQDNTAISAEKEVRE